VSVIEESLDLPIELLGSIERYAVYRCYGGDGQLLYVGETGDLGKRLADHAKKLWFVQVRGITLEWYADELDALKAERRAIHVEHPKYNKQHRYTPLSEPKRRPSRTAKPARPTSGRHIGPRNIPHEELEQQVRELFEIDPNISIKQASIKLGRSRDRISPILTAMKNRASMQTMERRA
jgi:predicted GIY-YIG superfamily endonuclease